MSNHTGFPANLRALREERGISQEKLAEMIGVTKQTVMKWELGRTKAPRQQDTMEALCGVFGVTVPELFGYADGYYSQAIDRTWEPEPYTGTAPVLGNIAAGDPREAIEDGEERHPVPAWLAERCPGGFFLRVAGDSMNLAIPDGAYVYIDTAAEVHSGDIVAVKVNGDEATIKRLRMYEGLVILMPESTNPEHRRRVIDASDPDAPEVRILGRAVWFDCAL